MKPASLVVVGDYLDTLNSTATLNNLSLVEGGPTAGGSGYELGYTPIENYSIRTLDHVRVQNNNSAMGSISNIGLLNIADGIFSTTVTGEDNNKGICSLVTAPSLR